VPWHLIDVCDASEEFTVARFQRLVSEAIGAIEARGHRALLVGGTGLYHRAVVDELDLPGRYPDVRAALEEEAATATGLARLYERLSKCDPLAASRMEPTNARRIVRALEVAIGSGKPFSAHGAGLEHYAPTRFGTIGLSIEREALDRRVAERLDRQLSDGFVEEAARLAEQPDRLSRTARQALGYEELFAYLAGGCTLAEARERIVRRTRTFARRQQAWFRRDPRIVWIDASAPDVSSRFAALADSFRDQANNEPARD
jgi:tRNA dimethylallyltransferase